MEKNLKNVMSECYINHQHCCNNVVKTLNNKKDEISLLQKVLTYLCENKYQSNVEEIKALCNEIAK